MTSLGVVEAGSPEVAQDVFVVERAGRRIVVVGTAHISHESVALVRRVIEQESPDVVCVELDERRHRALSDQGKWEALDLKTVIREKQLSTLVVTLLLSAYQRRMGAALGAKPGQEMLEATLVAQAQGIPVRLCDRDVRTTLRRAWRSMTLREKMLFLSSGLAGLFERPNFTEEDLQRLRSQDVLSGLLEELGRTMPVLKRVLLDERDVYLAQRIREAEGKTVVAVVGAGHVQGIVRELEEGEPVDVVALERIPRPSVGLRGIGWGIPLLILGSLAYIGFTKGPEAAGANALFWVLVNAIPASLGVLVAMGHPITALAAFLTSPLTSLTPVIGVGYVAAFVQAWASPPVVRELQEVSKEVTCIRCWWKNRLLRILLVFILSSLGGVFGTYLGAYGIMSNVL